MSAAGSAQPRRTRERLRCRVGCAARAAGAVSARTGKSDDAPHNASTRQPDHHVVSRQIGGPGPLHLQRMPHPATRADTPAPTSSRLPPSRLCLVPRDCLLHLRQGACPSSCRAVLMVVADRPVKWKKRRGSRGPPATHPAEDGARLAALALAGTFAREAAWLSVPPDIAQLLDRTCTGRGAALGTQPCFFGCAPPPRRRPGRPLCARLRRERRRADTPPQAPSAGHGG